MKLTKFILLLLFINLYGYENGKIDMHGGKGDALNSNGGFSNNFNSLLEIKPKENSEEKEKILKKKKQIIEEEKKENNE